MSGTDAPAKGKSLKELDRAVVRFAGDSGDGIDRKSTRLNSSH